jgi:hypothetical protein
MSQFNIQSSPNEVRFTFKPTNTSSVVELGKYGLTVKSDGKTERDFRYYEFSSCLNKALDYALEGYEPVIKDGKFANFNQKDHRENKKKQWFSGKLVIFYQKLLSKAFKVEWEKLLK